MSYTLRFEHKKNFLYASVQGKNTAENVSLYLSEVRMKCLELQCPRVLIEENLEGPGLGTFTIFDVISNASGRVAPFGLRIAYVDSNPEHDAMNLKFAENIAVNRGVIVKVFSNVEEAEKWLTSTET